MIPLKTDLMIILHKGLTAKFDNGNKHMLVMWFVCHFVNTELTLTKCLLKQNLLFEIKFMYMIRDNRQKNKF